MDRVKSVLIIGGSGVVGTHLALQLRESCKVYCTYRRNHFKIPGVTQIPLDVDNRDWAKRVIYVAQPDAVIYAAGTNNTVTGEDTVRAADRIHATGAASMAHVADILQPTFIYLSNSYVFDGSDGNYHDTDTPLPANPLGKAKLNGENFVKSRALNYVIVRSAPLLMRGNGYNTSMIDKLRMALDRGQRVELPHEELHNFAPIHGLCELIRTIIETRIRKKIFHYGGLTKTTHYELGKAFAERVGYDAKLVFPATSGSRRATTTPEKTTREDFSLNFTQTIEALKVKPLFLEESLDLINQHLIAGA